jgi:hypothetical protein
VKMWFTTRRPSPTAFSATLQPWIQRNTNNNDSSSATSLVTSSTERGILHKNVYGQPIRIFAHLPSNGLYESSIDRYQILHGIDPINPINDGKACFFNTNCISYAMLRAKADGISIDMISKVFELFSDDLRELNWLTFEKDVQAMCREQDSELLKGLLANPALKAQLQDFSVLSNVKKADLLEEWPTLCKFGHLNAEEEAELCEIVKKENEGVDIDDEIIVKEKEQDDQAGLLVQKVAASAAAASLCSVDNSAAERCEKDLSVSHKKCSVDDDDEITLSSSEKSACGKGDESKALIVSSGKKTMTAMSNKLSVVSGQRLMLLLVFLMVIYRGLNMLIQQRKVKSLVSKPSLDSLVSSEKH